MKWSSYGRQCMKKFIIILVALFCTHNVYALSQQSAIDQHLKGRKLDKIEGVWYAPPDKFGKDTSIIVYKYGSSYNAISLKTNDSGELKWSVNKLGPGTYKGTCTINQYSTLNTSKVIAEHPGQRLSINMYSDDNASWSCSYYIQGYSGTVSESLSRVWPSNFKAHNAKFKKDDTTKVTSNSKKISPSSGTAFFITDKGHLITNHHVVEGCKDKSKIVYKDKEYPAKLIAKDKLLDFALLKADISRNKFVVLSDDPPKKLQRIIAAGYPLGKYLSDDLKFTSGIISSLKGMDDDSTLIQIDAALNKGNSGGPIVNEETGELVAVAVAGLRKDKTEAVNFGIKTNSLKNFLDANQIKTTGSKMLFSFGNVDVSNILEESTVYTFCK